MSNAKSQPSGLKGFFLVRDKDGNPKFDDYHNIPEEYKHILSESDWEYIHKMRGN